MLGRQGQTSTTLVGLEQLSLEETQDSSNGEQSLFRELEMHCDQLQFWIKSEEEKCDLPWFFHKKSLDEIFG